MHYIQSLKSYWRRERNCILHLANLLYRSAVSSGSYYSTFRSLSSFSTEVDVISVSENSDTVSRFTQQITWNKFLMLWPWKVLRVHVVMLILKLVAMVWRTPRDLQLLRRLTPQGNLQNFRCIYCTNLNKGEAEFPGSKVFIAPCGTGLWGQFRYSQPVIKLFLKAWHSLNKLHGTEPILEKTSVAQLLKDFTTFYGTRKFIFFSMAWVRERAIPTERLPLVGEVIANFCG
jgi:hypothetical protein